MSRPTPSAQVLQEWDVTRRTAEFFDQQIDRVREVAITASVAIIGIALQFKWEFGSSLLPLNLASLFIDYRARRYLVRVTDYANRIEDTFAFGGQGLTVSIKQKAGTRKERVLSRLTTPLIYSVYLVFASLGLAVGVVALVPIVQSWISLLLTVMRAFGTYH